MSDLAEGRCLEETSSNLPIYDTRLKLALFFVAVSTPLQYQSIATLLCSRRLKRIAEESQVCKN